jgi:DNA invertase Pin-like site-specific DNA recombinase
VRSGKTFQIVRAVRNVLLALVLAKVEAQKISKRTKAGMDAARHRSRG